MGKEYEAMKAAFEDMAAEGKAQYKEAEGSIDQRKSSKQDVFYEDGDGGFETSWKGTVAMIKSLLPWNWFSTRTRDAVDIDEKPDNLR